jgi:hypothetical protein
MARVVHADLIVAETLLRVPLRQCLDGFEQGYSLSRLQPGLHHLHSRMPPLLARYRYPHRGPVTAIIVQPELPLRHAVLQISKPADNELLAGRAVFGLHHAAIAYLQQFHDAAQCRMWRNTSRHTLGPVGEVLLDQELPAPPDPHALDAVTQAGEALTLA